MQCPSNFFRNSKVGGIGPLQSLVNSTLSQVGAASARKAHPEIFCEEHFVNSQSMEIHLPYNISSSVISQEPKHLTNNGNTSNKEHSGITREHLEAGGLLEPPLGSSCAGRSYGSPNAPWGPFHHHLVLWKTLDLFPYL